jgi:Zn-finger nucleic acid-binding protein
MNGLTCPKCQGAMRSYERSGVTVDQCTECRGIFLDRGELERLIDAENSHYEGSQERQPEYREHREEHHREHHGHHGKRRKRSFLEDLFE